MGTKCCGAKRSVVVLAWAGLAVGSAAGQTSATEPHAPAAERFDRSLATPYFVVAEPARTGRLYSSGEQVTMECESIWKPVCGSEPGSVSVKDLETMAGTHSETFAPGQPVTIVDREREYGERAGFNVVFVLGANVPAAALPAFAAAEAYLEAQFQDPITVTVSVSFAALQPGVLGGTSSSYVYTNYGAVRAGLATGMDGNDSIQSFLPTTSTVPVRYRGNRPTVTNEDRVFFTIANCNATVAAFAGNAASMQYSTNFTWDYDPSNGVATNAYSFQDVIIHEVGHALGFTSGADFRNNDLEMLDLFRFQRTDGNGDFNPDTTAEFQSRPRLVSYNSPNDDHNSDLISVEYRMSDGYPQQASHFRDQTPPIGIMDPTLGYGQTFYPNFFLSSDLTMFDAIGYDR